MAHVLKKVTEEKETEKKKAHDLEKVPTHMYTQKGTWKKMLIATGDSKGHPWYSTPTIKLMRNLPYNMTGNGFQITYVHLRKKSYVNYTTQSFICMARQSRSARCTCFPPLYTSAHVEPARRQERNAVHWHSWQQRDSLCVGDCCNAGSAT